MKPRQLTTQAQLEFFKRGVAAGEALDEALQLCWCGHSRATHLKTGHCSAESCPCIRFGKEVG